MNENINNIYRQLEDKNCFILTAAEEFGKAAITIKSHWVGGLRQVPEEHQDRFHTLILNWAKQELARKGEVIKANS